MFKDIVISILAAVILSDVSWLSYEQSEKWIIIMGLTIVLLFFLLFLEEKLEKMRRVKKIRRILEKLKHLKLRRAA